METSTMYMYTIHGQARRMFKVKMLAAMHAAPSTPGLEARRAAHAPNEGEDALPRPRLQSSSKGEESETGGLSAVRLECTFKSATGTCPRGLLSAAVTRPVRPNAGHGGVDPDRSHGHRGLHPVRAAAGGARGAGGSWGHYLDPPGLLPTFFIAASMEYSECLPALSNILTERTSRPQAVGPR